MPKEKYIIIEALNPTYLARMVNEHMDKGYEPIGGVCHVSCATACDKFLQAMRKAH